MTVAQFQDGYFQTIGNGSAENNKAHAPLAWRHRIRSRWKKQGICNARIAQSDSPADLVPTKAAIGIGSLKSATES
jgi:hypothetical protein